MNKSIFLFAILVGACTATGTIEPNIKCTTSCEDRQQDCYNVCRTTCTNASGDLDEACDTDCHTECDTAHRDCTFSCTGTSDAG